MERNGRGGRPEVLVGGQWMEFGSDVGGKWFLVAVANGRVAIFVREP